MKKLILPLLLLTCLLTSCNNGKLEWWEVVNPPKHRLEDASGRNDNSALEQRLFDAMDNLESETRSSRVHDALGSGVLWIQIAALLELFSCLALVIVGLVARFSPTPKDWVLFVLIALVLIIALINLPLHLYVNNGNNRHSTDIGALIMLFGYIFAVPYILYADILDVNRYAPSALVGYAYTAVLPVSMVGGAFFRVVATYGSYVFVALMLVYIVASLLKAIYRREPFMRVVVGFVFKLLITFSTVFLLYEAMPAMVSVVSTFFLLLLVFAVATSPSAKYDSYSSKEYDSSSDNEDKIDYYGPDNMRNTYMKNSDGDDIYKSESDGRYYKHTWTGYEEVDEP